MGRWLPGSARTKAMLAAILAAGFVLAFANVQAHAHAVLLETSPAKGATLQESPDEVILRFDEPVSPVKLRVLDETGQKVPVSGRITALNREVRLALTGPLPDGRYLVSYRVVSLDSHPVAASFFFAVGEVAEDGQEMADLAARVERDGSAAIPAYLNRFVRYLSILLAAGMAIFLCLFPLPRDISRQVEAAAVTMAAVAAVSSVLMVGLGGAELTGVGLEQLLTLEVWSTGADATLSTSAAVALTGLVMLIAGFRLSGETMRPAMLIAGGMLALASFAFTGHAALARPTWIMTPAVILHGATAAFWIGSLWPLDLVVRNGSEEAGAAFLGDFSRRAVKVVAALIAAAVVLSIVQMAYDATLITTRYGLLLAAKIVLVGGMLGLAIANKWRFVPALAEGRQGARRGLGVTIKAELLLAVIVVAVAAGLGTVPPPRSLAEVPPQPGASAATSVASTRSDQHRLLDGPEGIILNLTVSPARPGPNLIILDFSDRKERPFEPQEVTVEWSLPEAEVEPLLTTPARNRPGTYQADDAVMTIPGEWHLRIDALIDDYTKAIFRTTVLIGKEGDEIAEAPQYEGIGVIIATDPSASRLIVDHEEIRGFMAAMVMGYVVDSPVLLDGLMEGDRVRFTIDAEKNAIVRIERIASD
jgi:copper transport protein